MPTNDNSALLPFIREAWSEGYQAAVDALREMADAPPGNEELAALIRKLADTLQGVKP